MDYEMTPAPCIKTNENIMLEQLSNAKHSKHTSEVESITDLRSTSLTIKTITSEQYEKEKEICFKTFDSWVAEDQTDFIEDLLLRMTHYQHGRINTFLKPMLQRDFISALPGNLHKVPIKENKASRFQFLEVVLLMELLHCQID